MLRRLPSSTFLSFFIQANIIPYSVDKLSIYWLVCSQRSFVKFPLRCILYQLSLSYFNDLRIIDNVYCGSDKEYDTTWFLLATPPLFLVYLVYF